MKNFWMRVQIMGQPSINGHRSQILIGKFNILLSILAGQSIYPENNLKKFYHESRLKNREEILIDVVSWCLKSDFANSHYIKNFIPKIFDYILQINSFSVEKEFIFTHFEKIILLGVKNQDFFIRFLLKIAEKLPKEYQKNTQQEQVDCYNYVKTNYPALQNNLETIKEGCKQQATNTDTFDAFINFIYQSIKNDKKEVSDRQEKATDLLNEIALERQQEQKESLKHFLQKKGSKQQVELGVYDDNAYSTVELKEPIESREITSEIDSKRVSKNNHSKKIMDWSEKLLSLQSEEFPEQQVNTVEQEMKQAISDNKETVEAYNALTDLYLLLSKKYMDHYSKCYKSIIIKNKGTFGTPDFDAGKNRQVTEALDNISDTLKNISEYLEKAKSTLEDLILLAGNNSFRTDNDILVQITSDTFKTLLNELLNYLQDLGEWKNNKLDYVKKYGVVSNKSSAKKEIERKAFQNIRHCVESLDNFKTFIQKYLEKQQPYHATEKAAVVYPAIVNALSASPDGDLQQLHQAWCIGSNLDKLDLVNNSPPAELLQCTC